MSRNIPGVLRFVADVNRVEPEAGTNLAELYLRSKPGTSQSGPGLADRSWAWPCGLWLWPVAVAFGCGLWLWPVAWGCAYGCSPECSQKQCSRLRETIVSYKTYRLVYAERSYSNWVLTGWRPLLAPRGCPRSFLARQPPKSSLPCGQNAYQFPGLKFVGLAPIQKQASRLRETVISDKTYALAHVE